ncbi:unnamed protein product [Porites evermanni]|uniref:Alpha-dystroglycan N-terminal domain-containing protein n=1 Tax=Porites evermanni TaxID=104178 RepID=A0ABN8MA80_9CNID|nr:unnamed protein product [Porites evermanni]
MIPTEWPPCSCCLQNNRTFESYGKSTVHQGHQRCSALMQILHPFVDSCLSCNRNLKCKPWRRKSLSQPFAKWTLLNAVPWMALILLLSNYIQQSIQILARTFSVRKNPRLSSLGGLLSMVLFGGLFSLPLASCQDNLQPTPSVKSLQLPNTMVYVGSSFVYNISEEVFDCEVESFVVSETADRFLSHWLAYNSYKRQLYGVPSEKDEGTYNILVVALSRDGDEVRGRVCGSRSFFIKVAPVSEELVMSVYPSTDTSGSNIKTVQSLPCVPGSQVIHGTIILNVDVHNMNGHERMVLLLKMADHLNVHSSKVSLFSGQATHPLIGQLDNPVVMAAGAGDGRFSKGSRSLLTWHMGCGAIKLDEVAFSKLETNAQDGSISSLLGVPVVGWHVMSGTQKNMAKHRVRRQVMGVTATPIPSSALPSRISNMSTSVIISRTVAITSKSTASVSSVVLNRTEVSSFTISANTTTGTGQLPSRTDIQSSVFANVTSSARSFSPSSIMRTKSVSINSSTVILSRNTTVPVQSSELMSSVNRTALIMPSSILSQSQNSTFITRTVTRAIVSSFLTLSSSLPARNSSSISPNETTAIGSSSSALPSLNNRTVLTSSEVGTSSLNLTLTSPTLQVSSSLETRTSSFATPSSKQVLIVSSRLTSSASPHLTTHSPPSVVISTPPLNVSTSPAMSLTISRQSSLTVSLSSSFVSSRNTSVQEQAPLSIKQVLV